MPSNAVPALGSSVNMLTDVSARAGEDRPPHRDHPMSRNRPIRPIGAYAIHGLAFWNGHPIVLDAARGHLLMVDPQTDSTTVLNTYNARDFLDARGLAIAPADAEHPDPTVWFACDRDIYWCTLTDFTPRHFLSLPYPVDGVAVWQSTVYASSRQAGYIYVLNRNSQQRITQFYAPGIGPENLAIRGEELWVCDSLEQTVYCLERATGDIQFSAMTPYESPTAIDFCPNPEGEGSTLYVAYASEEPYIRDDPNAPNPFQLAFRDRTFLHPLHVYYNRDKRCVLSNGYLIEMYYVEEIAPLEAVDFERLQGLEWRIALPSDTDRQTVRRVEPVGTPFTEEIQDGQRVAVFQFGHLQPNEARLFGWRAEIEVRGIRYQIAPIDVEQVDVEQDSPLPADFHDRYLIDNDDLAMASPVVQAAAAAAVGRETNLLRRMLSIRNYVYDRLAYGIRPKIDTPDVVLERGIGSCGEYVGVLLALARLNGIACRTVGRYKCPSPGDRVLVCLYPDYNHVWLEFYLPGLGWVPMESNPDDIQEGGPYPTRYFMGLPWNHVEIAKGIRFQGVQVNGEVIEGLSVGDLAMNHVRFTILAELPPPDVNT